jgi:hypothetical protein
MPCVPCAPVALALTVLAQQAPPASSTITSIPSSAAEAKPATPAGVQVPPLVDPTLVHRPRLGPLISGAVVFGVSYAAAAFFAWAGLVTCIEDDDPNCGSQAKFLLIPLAGPLIAASRDGGSSDLFDEFGWPTYAAASLVQVAGAALLIYGAVGHDVPRKRPLPRGAVGFAPVVSRTALGVGLNGTW